MNAIDDINAYSAQPLINAEEMKAIFFLTLQGKAQIKEEAIANNFGVFEKPQLDNLVFVNQMA